MLLLIFNTGCNSIPKIPVNGGFLGEKVITTVDSDIARYYLEHYLQNKKSNPVFDSKIDKLYHHLRDSLPTREELKTISLSFSVDFAALFFADRLWSDEKNRNLQRTFNWFLTEGKDSSYCSPSQLPTYIVLFIPGWDYVENGHVTGADFAAPRKLLTDLGFENYLVEIPPTGSVEDNAEYLSTTIIEYSKCGKKIIIVGASSAGPAIHLSLGEQLNQEKLQSIKAWINIGGILQGSPLIDYYQEWPQCWLFNIVQWIKGWDNEKLLSMSVKRSRERFKRLTLSPNILVINYLGLSLSGQISKNSQDKYPLLISEGPNDGLTLLTDIIAPGSITIIALGNDHFFAEDSSIDDKTIALTKTIIFYLEKKVKDKFLDL